MKEWKVILTFGNIAFFKNSMNNYNFTIFNNRIYYKTYFRYKWLISSWSKCSQPVSNASVQCGGGLQYRNITCIETMTRKFMDSSICRILDTPPTIQRLTIF